MKDKSLSARTVRGLHAMLRTALDQAVKERLIPYNPAIGCRLPPKEKKEMQILPPEKIGAYLRAAEEHGVLPMFYLELTTGLRRGEITALLWTDLNVKDRTLTVSKSAGRLKGEVRVTQPKTANSVRTIILPEETVELLVQEHAKHPDNPVMFPSPVTGKMYGPDCVGRMHKTLLKKAGITEKLRFHDLRHTYATLAIQNGVDIKTVSNILGHYSAGFTLDTYTHITGEGNITGLSGCFACSCTRRSTVSCGRMIVRTELAVFGWVTRTSPFRRPADFDTVKVLSFTLRSVQRRAVISPLLSPVVNSR